MGTKQREPVKQYLSDPVHQEYATKLSLIGIFISIFAVFVSRLSILRRGRKDFKISSLDWALLSFSTLRLGRMVAFDEVAEPLRSPFTQTVPDASGAGETVTAKGTGVRRSLGELISCPICAGTWIAAGLVYGLHTIPNPTRVFLAIIGTTGAVEMLNALTEWLSWSSQLARTLTGARQNEGRDQTEGESIDHLINQGGKYYVRQDHQEYYRQG